MTTEEVYNLIILDESGSMSSIKNSTISGFNELVDTIRGIEKQYPDQKHFISMVSFNGVGIKTLLDKQPVSTLHPIDDRSYQPNSLTPLYDAIGISVLKLRIDLAEKHNTHVLVTILTDGEENNSREFNGVQVKKIIDEQKEKGWTFTYIGANHDIEKAAMNISITNTMKFDANDTDVQHMFRKERAARERFSQKIYSKLIKTEDFYKEDEEDNGKTKGKA